MDAPNTRGIRETQKVEQQVKITKKGLERLVHLGELWDEGSSAHAGIRTIERIVLLSIAAREYNTNNYLLFPADPWNSKNNLFKDTKDGHNLALWIIQHPECMPNESILESRRAINFFYNGNFSIEKYKLLVSDLLDRGLLEGEVIVRGV